MISYINEIKSKLVGRNENNKEILSNTMGAFFVKGGALIISLFTMPAYMRYFGDQQILGLWFTILSVLSWILTFDLGIGNGLRNHLVSAIVKKDQQLVKKYISSSYIVIGIIVLTTVLLSSIFFRYINWNSVFNIPDAVISKEVLSITVGIVFFGIMLQFFLKLISSVLYAMQKSSLINLLSLCSSIITLMYVFFVKPTTTSYNLISLAVVNIIAVNLPLAIANIIVFTKPLKGCKPEIKFFELKYAKVVMKLGGMFFWVQIMYMVITTTNEILITNLARPEEVVQYQIYNKLFTLIGAIFMLALTPIWSAVTKALAEQKYEWIKRLYNILRLIALIAVICEFLMLLILQLIINFWLRENAIHVNYFYATMFAIYGSLLIWSGVLSSIANGFGELKTQCIYFTLGAIIKIPVAWLVVSLSGSWIGVIIANIVAMGFYCIAQPFWLNTFFQKKDVETGQMK